MVPPVSLVEKQMAEFSAEIVQQREIIRRFDENLGDRAMKADINAYSKELRLLCKEKPFLEYKGESETHFY